MIQAPKLQEIGIGLQKLWKRKCQSLSPARFFAVPWIVAHQVPLSMEYSRQEYRNGLPFPSPRDLPNPGIEPDSSTLQADSLPSEPPERRPPPQKLYALWNDNIIQCLLQKWLKKTKNIIRGTIRASEDMDKEALSGKPSLSREHSSALGEGERPPSTSLVSAFGISKLLKTNDCHAFIFPISKWKGSL